MGAVHKRTGPAGRLAGCVLLLLGGPAWIAGQTVRPLAEGAALDGELKGGEAHNYDVELSAGDYLHVTIDQRGIDVRPVVRAPNGKTVYEYDYGEWGREPVTLIAPMDGRYRLEVRAEIASAPRGRYQLFVEALRPATPDDGARARIMKLQVDAFPLVRSKTRNYQRARPLYEEILAEWESLGDRAGAAHALTVLRYIAHSLDDRATAADYARREAAVYREIGDDYGEARALRDLAINIRAVGEFVDALNALERSLALHRAAGRSSSENLLLADIANSHGAAGNFATALQYAYEAVALARRRDDPRHEALGLSAAALIHQSLGELEVAVDAYQRVRTLVPDDERMQADSSMRMGIATLELGNLHEAERLLDAALAVWTRRGWRAQQGQALVALGDLHLRRDNPLRARELFEQAAALAAETHYPLGEVVARRRLADTLLRLGGHIAEAESEISRAAALLDKIANPNAHALLFSSEARIALARQDLATARERAGKAVDLTESVRGRAQSPRIHAALLASTQTVYETAARILMASHADNPRAGYDRRALEVSERARARSLQDMILSGTHESLAAANATVIDELRSVQRRLNAKARALETARQAGKPSAVAALSREVDELAAEFAVVEGRLRSESPAFASVVSLEPFSIQAFQRDVLDAATVLVEYLLDEPHSYAWVVSRDGVVAHRLASRSRIEEAARDLHQIATAPRSAAATRLPLPSTVAMSRLLLGPIRDVPRGRRLLIVAPGLLQNVPFAALPIDERGGEPLVARHEIVYAPSAAVVSAMRSVAATRGRARRTLAVFADPVFDMSDPRVLASARAVDAARTPSVPSPLVRATRSAASGEERAVLVRLPFTRIEADRIASLVKGRSVFKATGFSASLRVLTDTSLADYRILHFATHGVLNTRTPDLSGLVFSLVDERGRPQEGFLRLHDVERLRLNADLAVLSGCETALGRRVEGEGIIGLTRGFIAAGARRVVASLWKVDDLATAELMQAFYSNMLERKLTAAAALRAAQQQLSASDRWRHPYFWAGFVIQGEWR